MVQLSLIGKNAIVTGAGQGIGKAISLKLAEAGANVAVVDISMDNAKQTASEVSAHGVKGKAYKVDVTDPEAMDTLADTVAKEWGSLDIIVNNAGIGHCVLFQDSNLEQFNRLIDVNLKGVYNGCHAAIKHMIKQKSGKIVNVSSAAGKKGYIYHSLYSPTKFGVIGLTQALAIEAASSNINVNAICPGIVRTPIWEKNLSDMIPDGENMDEIQEQREQLFNATLEQSIPLGRPQSAEDMANGVLFLCSEMAANITGQALNINGGQLFN
ncbi:MAG: SDR family NAD(P)-dependent oxidoreductase [Candidatus Fimivivens sp.]